MSNVITWNDEYVAEDPGIAMVREFHDVFDCHINAEPGLPELTLIERKQISHHASRLAMAASLLKHEAAQANDLGRTALGLVLVRLQLQVEETAEVFQAVADGDIVHVLHELSDLSYVTDGTYLTFGLGALKTAADAELHRANMSKLDVDGKPILSTAGRVVKGPFYKKPDMEKILRERPGGE